MDKIAEKIMTLFDTHKGYTCEYNDQGTELDVYKYNTKTKSYHYVCSLKLIVHK